MTQAKYRMIREVRMEREYGYVDRSENHYNVLQVCLTNPFAILWNMGKWKNVEEEPIPSFAWIEAATLGSTNWKSALHEKHRDKLVKNK